MSFADLSLDTATSLTCLGGGGCQSVSGFGPVCDGLRMENGRWGQDRERLAYVPALRRGGDLLLNLLQL